MKKQISGAIDQQYVSFWIAGMRFGVPIASVREINRLVNATPVPGAGHFVHGVVNLRGDVVTVINARSIFAEGTDQTTNQTRNVILQSDGEVIGLLVDQVDDILDIEHLQSQPVPANLGPAHRRFVTSVYTLDDSLLLVIDPELMLNELEVDASGVVA